MSHYEYTPPPVDPSIDVEWARRIIQVMRETKMARPDRFGRVCALVEQA